MHLNRECCAPDLRYLFILTDVTAGVEAFLPTVAADTAVMRQLLAQPDSPNTPLAATALGPIPAPFTTTAGRRVQGLTIYDIPRLTGKKERPPDAGVLYLADVPASATFCRRMGR